MALRMLADVDRRFGKNPTGNRFHQGQFFFQKRKLMRSKARIGAIPLLVYYTVLAILISGCSSAGGSAELISSNSGKTGSGTGNIGSNISGTSTPTTLAWDAPLTYDDGITPIAPGELTGYRMYIYTDADLTAKYADYLVSGPNPPTSIDLIDFNTTVFTDEISRGTSTTYYLAVTAIVTVNGMEIESAPSNSKSYTYP